MKAYDTIKKVELEVDVQELLRLMREENRQVDLILFGKKTDSDGYLTWDEDHWSSVDDRRYIRYYTLEGRQLRDSTTHNIYDVRTDFLPEEAKEIRLS